MALGSGRGAPGRRPRAERSRSGSAAVHAYHLRPSGVHAVALEEALGILGDSAAPRDGSPPILWFDIVCPGEAEANLMRDRLHLHPLAVEDCLRGRQRPKLDRYPGYLFLVLYAASLNPDRNRPALEELHVFVGERFIVTVHDHKLREVTGVIADWRANAAAFPSTGHLAHALFDTVVDSYLPVIDALDGTVDELEQEVLDPERDTEMRRILDLRRELSAIRRMLSPTRDVLRTLMRRDIPLLSPELVPYFQDVLDHAERGAEELDSLRDALAAALDAYLSISANQLNQTMRLMAAWSIILMAMAWIAGVYGMNFVVMPELEWRLGYAWALGLMLAIGGGLLAYFRRRSWL